MGAFTGEISAEHAKDMNIPWTILGIKFSQKVIVKEDNFITNLVKSLVKK